MYEGLKKFFTNLSYGHVIFCDKQQRKLKIFSFSLMTANMVEMGKIIIMTFSDVADDKNSCSSLSNPLILSLIEVAGAGQ